MLPGDDNGVTVTHHHVTKPGVQIAPQLHFQSAGRPLHHEPVAERKKPRPTSWAQVFADDDYNDGLSFI